MKNYFALFCVPAATMQNWMETTDEATRKEQTDQMMQDWNAWMAERGAALVDKGLPLGKTKRVTKDAVMDAKNDLNYYVVVQADSHEAAAEMFKNNPHLQIPDAYVDVMDTSGGGGM